MSQFNNPYPQTPIGQKPMPDGTPYGTAPQRPSSGSNIVLIVLAIVFGILLLVVIACGALGFMASRAMSSFTKEIEEMVILPMANEAVERYRDHEEVQKHIGEIKDYHFENPGIEMMGRPVIRLEIEGNIGKGKIVFYQRSGKPHKVMLEVDGQEILLDDNPEEFFETDFDESDLNRPDFSEEMKEDDSFPSEVEEPLKKEPE